MQADQHFGDPSLMTPAWSADNSESAISEGWEIFDTQDSEGGPWQVQRVDDATELACVQQLADDKAAWKLVLNGHEPHHKAAREFIKNHNPKEWEAMISNQNGHECVTIDS